MCSDYFKKENEISLKEFNAFCRSDSFSDGPWEEGVNGIYRDMVYIPYKKIYGNLKNGSFVWAWKNKPRITENII